MALSAGARLGPYEILASSAPGGMGEVYRARDTRLGRDGRLKVLPAVAGDAERLSRFEQEARSRGLPQPPNIVASTTSGREGEQSYVGHGAARGPDPPRSARRRPLPSRKAIEYAVQIAHGLAAAHDKGIVHRDLKPENVFVTATGG